MNFSIILNSRGRISLLFNLLESIYSTASRPEAVEVFLNIDLDDTASVQAGALLEFNFKNVKVQTGERPTNLHKPINEMAKKSKGDYLFALNDDVTFLTQGWDKIILEKSEEFLNRHSDDIMYAGVSDNSFDKANHQRYASFPIISRPSYEALGYFMPEKFVALGADVFLYRIFESVDRILLIDNVRLDHFYHSTLDAVNSPDETATHMRNITYENLPAGNPWEIDISKESELLNEKIASSL